ncbi:small nuclear ribonucleoprotein [Exophiala aquamarina CBS 119918]|uniref:U6 snRNA-associated Sm-like protein LSm6 n=1 Tax=Exophiala aquamarina CBS 119918 TaxID=1182545 RepID=A0A072PTZ2_9EURO|nr:small nuclear ribonucleoprotein [Exophiala aquamarina CBS 119918]KEF62773.1 small nuclear ribonucleoprotein [Exophiala aquamarina CBS 119918]
MENHNSNDPKDPASFLSSIIGVPVTVKLNSGVVYKGELQSVDGYMNIALEKCQEFVNGQLRRDYGDAFVRGNNGECHCKWISVVVSTRESEWNPQLAT